MGSIQGEVPLSEVITNPDDDWKNSPGKLATDSLASKPLLVPLLRTWKLIGKLVDPAIQSAY